MKPIVIQISWLKFVLITGLVWLLQGTYSTLNTGLFQQYNGMDVKWMAISIYSFGTAFVWWILTSLILWCIMKISSFTSSLSKRTFIHLGLALIFSSIQRLINIAITFNLIKWTEAVDLSLLKLENFFGMNFLRNVGNGILVYLVIAAILYGYLYYLQNKEQEIQKSQLSAELSKVKLENLKYQLQPHFLFNSLQSVSTLLHRDTKAADRALGNLGDLLRYSIRNMDTETVSLGEELLNLQKYIDLQQTRFRDRLRVRINAEDELMGVRVPVLFLQPIVENSIKHNIESTGSKVLIDISIKKDANLVLFDIEDDGAHEQRSKLSNGNGMGLKNLQLRLEALYGDNASFDMRKLSPSGFKTEIKIPVA